MTTECGCERGDDCTKTTMCHVQSVVEDKTWHLEDEIQRLQEALCDVDAVIQKMSLKSGLGGIWVGRQYSLGAAISDLEAAVGGLEKPTLPAETTSKASKSMQKRINIQKGKPMMEDVT